MKKIFIGVAAIFLIIIGISLYFQNGQKTEEMVKTKETIKTEASDIPVAKYIDVTAPEAKKLIDENPNLIIIDVSPKYQSGHLPGAINYYIGDGTLEKVVPTLDKEATYLVYCHVDSASIPGAQRLIDEGIKNVYRLKGNYSAWVDAGYPIEK